ncbi:MAG: guanylate kinase [Desulfobacterales bacterium]|nr:guanylate kinase [Desulfobacterales bacterium]
MLYTSIPRPTGHDQTRRQGLLFVISAPSGAGKTTLCKSVRSDFPDLLYSVSYTTRKPRSGEREGVDYHFISAKDFKERIRQGRWAEWAEVHGNIYGTSADVIDAGLSAGRDILLDIDVQGAVQILARYPECITIFIMPPDMETLRRRLESRGTDGREEIARRLKNAEAEMAQRDLYRHVILNDRLDEAQKELKTLIRKYRTERGLR